MQDSIEHTLVIAAPIGRVWYALTDHQQFGLWFKAVVERPFTADLTVDCRSTYPGHEHLTWDMQIITMQPNSRFEFKWDAYYGEDTDRDASQDPQLTVTFDLRAAGEKTIIDFAESGFSKLPPEYGSIAYKINMGGWVQQMENIKSHIEAMKS